jgi:hypothetical protein
MGRPPTRPTARRTPAWAARNAVSPRERCKSIVSAPAFACVLGSWSPPESAESLSRSGAYPSLVEGSIAGSESAIDYFSRASLSVPRSRSPTQGASRQRDPWPVHAQTVGGIVHGPQSGTLRRGSVKIRRSAPSTVATTIVGGAEPVSCFPPPPRSPPPAQPAHSQGGRTVAPAGRPGKGQHYMNGSFGPEGVWSHDRW